MQQHISTFGNLVIIYMIGALIGCPCIRAKQCVKNTSCICEFDDGSGTFDIRRLGRQDGMPLIQDVFAIDGYAYSFNPCYPFTEGTCVNAAGCQVDMASAIYYNIGDALNVNFSFDGVNVIGTYISDHHARTSTVTYVCNQNVDVAQVTVNGETAPASYSFQIVSKYACPMPQPTPTPTIGPLPSVLELTNATIGSGHVVHPNLDCLLYVRGEVVSEAPDPDQAPGTKQEVVVCIKGLKDGHGIKYKPYCGPPAEKMG